MLSLVAALSPSFRYTVLPKAALRLCLEREILDKVYPHLAALYAHADETASSQLDEKLDSLSDMHPGMLDIAQVTKKGGPGFLKIARFFGRCWVWRNCQRTTGVWAQRMRWLHENSEKTERDLTTVDCEIAFFRLNCFGVSCAAFRATIADSVAKVAPENFIIQAAGEPLCRLPS